MPPPTEPSRIAGSVRDVDSLYRTLAEELQVGVLVQGPQAEILLSNPTALRLLGVTEDQLMGRTSFDPGWNVVHEDGAPFPGPTHPVPRAIAERRPVRGVVMGVHRPATDDRVWLLVDAIPTLEPDGSVRHVVCTFADITARVDAERACRASDVALKASQRVAQLGSWTWHIRENRLEWSDEMFRLFGIDPAGFTGDLAAVIAEAIHPDDRAAVERANRAVAEEGRPAPLAYRIVRKDGTVRTVRGEAGSLTRDAEGRAEVLTGIVQDITDRKRIEDALRASEAKFATAFQSSPTAITITRLRDRRYLEVNEAVLTMSGYAREELIGASADAIGLIADPAERERVAATILGGRPMVGEELVFRKKGGDVFHGRFWGRLIQLDGEPCLLSTVIDLTEHLRAEEARGRAEAMLVAATLANPDLVILKDLEGRWLFANPAALAVHGKTLDQVVGRTDLAISADESAARALMAVDRRVAASGVAETTELLVLTAHGPRHFVSTKAPFHDRDGRMLGVVTSARDVTDRKHADDEKAKLEAQLHQARKMESVGRLAGGVAHDFNNMLGVILGNTELALEEIDPASPLRADIEEVRAAALRSAELTRQLLAFARKQTITPKVVDLNGSVTGMLRLLERLIGENVRVTWRPGAALWPLRIDPSQIDQVLTNLCANARDAIGGIGEVTIETSNVSLPAGHRGAFFDAVAGDYVRLSVRDDGCGMDEATLARIFEPFFTTKEVGRGTGLGLATVYGIVKQNEGQIDVRSEPGRGTTFDLYFPRHVDEAAGTRTQGPAHAAPRGHETVLLVEDEPSFLRLTRRMLERMGHTVLAAATPGEALRRAEAHVGRIHLVVTDVIMPEMNGRELAERLRARHPGLRKLFMSGYSADVIASHSVLDEGVRFLAKPFSATELLAKVREALDAE